MGMVVRTNTMAMNAYRSLSANQGSVAKSLEKLSSGFRINRAGDDAAGLAISEKMKAQIKGLEQASANSQDGISLVQTAEGALTEVHNMLNRMVELGTKSANGTIQNEVDREAIQSEVDALKSEITRISKSTNFNGINLLDGSMGMAKGAFTQTAVASSAPDMAAQLGTVAAGTAHVSTPQTAQQLPEFSVDLGDLNVKTADAATTFTLKLGTQDLTTTAALANGANDATALATAVKNANATFTDATTNIVYDVTSTGSKLNFKAQAGTVLKTGDAVFSGAVGYKASAVTASSTGSVNHLTETLKDAVMETTGGRAGIQLALNDNMVKDGNKLTIDDKTYVFKNGKDSTVTAGAGEELIDLTGAAAGKEVEKAVELLTNKSTANFDIGGELGGKTIHIDQKVGNANKYETEKDLHAVFSLQTGAAAAAGSKVTVDGTKLKAGDAVRIDGKTYEFVKKGEAAVIDGATAVEVEGISDKVGTAATKDFTAALKSKLGASVLGSDDTSLTLKLSTEGKAPAVTGGGLTIQVGDTSDSFNKVTVAVDDMSSSGLGIGDLDVSSQVAAGKSIQTIKDAINMVSTNRANMGALQNRLEYTINNLDTTAENMTAANSRIRDTDMAKEMMNYTKMNILTQAAQAMLAQANQQPQAILQLLQ